MRLAAPTPAAGPDRGTPGGPGAARSFPLREATSGLAQVPGAALSGTPDPGRRGGPRRARGHTESAGGCPPQPAFLLSFRRPPTPAAPQPEVSSQRRSQPAPRRSASRTPEKSQSSWPQPGSFDSALCSVQGGAVSAQRPAEGRSQLGYHLLLGAGLSLPICKTARCGGHSRS